VTTWGLVIFVLLVALATWRAARGQGRPELRPPLEPLRFTPRSPERETDLPARGAPGSTVAPARER
jgi:hypothetical protein